jgi:hypothetical protein
MCCTLLVCDAPVEPLIQRSASKWTRDDLTKLRIEFDNIDLDSFLGKFQVGDEKHMLSERASAVIRELSDMPQSGDLAAAFGRENADDNGDNGLKAIMQSPLVKATYLCGKYSDHESIVDSFVHHLLHRLGFNDDWLYAFPQLSLPLRYGATSTTMAKADFAILHILSFYRMAVVEDKRVGNDMVNSEPQLIAEAIAMSQANKVESRKRSRSASTESSVNESGHSSSSGHPSPSSSTCSAALDGALFGVRVNGLKFYFYSIPVSDAVLTAMSNSCTSTAATTVSRLMYKNSACLDWAVYEQRTIIIRVLDAVRSYLSEKGSKSRRRDSFSANAKAIS